MGWTQSQRDLINDAIASEVENSRLAHKVIPEVRLPPTERAVAIDRFDYQNGTIDETHRNLLELAEAFFLSRLQVEDADLRNARLRVRRAAQELARRDDQTVFATSIRDEIAENQGKAGFHDIVTIDRPFADGVVSAVAYAVAALDGRGYRSGFVLVAGQEVYTQLHTRSAGAADLPIKAVEGLLEGGPVHRSAVLPTNEALVLSLSREEIDRAVAVTPTLEFLRIDNNDNREFRLYERFLARFRQTLSVALLRLQGDYNRGA